MTKKKMQLPLTCETHVHDGYGSSKDTPCPWCEIDRLRAAIEPVTSTIPSPSAVCALIGCTKREPHYHEVIER